MAAKRKWPKQTPGKAPSKDGGWKWWVMFLLAAFTFVGGFFFNDGLAITRHLTATTFGWGSDFEVTVNELDKTIYSNNNESFVVFVENRFNRQRYFDLNMRLDKGGQAYSISSPTNESFDNIKIEAGQQILIHAILVSGKLPEGENTLIVSVEDSTNEKNEDDRQQPFVVSSLNG